MPTLTITPRPRRSGMTYAVRYRLGGRAYPVVHAGTFKTLREAKVRRALVAGEIAHGRDPADLLAGLARTASPPVAVTLREWGERYSFASSSRRPVAGGTGERAPFVPRELIAGRALLVFWPLAPWKGVLRLKWVR